MNNLAVSNLLFEHLIVTRSCSNLDSVVKDPFLSFWRGDIAPTEICLCASWCNSAVRRTENNQICKSGFITFSSGPFFKPCSSSLSLFLSHPPLFPFLDLVTYLHLHAADSFFHFSFSFFVRFSFLSVLLHLLSLLFAWAFSHPNLIMRNAVWPWPPSAWAWPLTPAQNLSPSFWQLD